MTDIRELLTLAARAMGSLEIGRWANLPGRTVAVMETEEFWSPHDDDGDCARMCAALTICTDWTERRVICVHRGTYIYEKFADHNGDKSAAWRMAALRVAAEIGRGMQG